MPTTDAVTDVVEQGEVASVQLGQAEVEDLIPHRQAALFLKSAVVTTGRDGPRVVAEAFFNHEGLTSLHEGHFLNETVLMGVLIQEAIQQALALLAIYTAKMSGGSKGSSRSAILLGVSEVSWKKKVLPTDSITVEAYLKESRRSQVEGFGLARVGDDVICTVGGIHGMWGLRSKTEIDAVDGV